MNEEMKEASEANLEAALNEIEAVLNARSLAGIVLLTDGVSGNVMQQLAAPWNVLAVNEEGHLLMKRNDTRRKISATIRTLSMMAEMSIEVTNGLVATVKKAQEFFTGDAAEVESTLATPVEAPALETEARAPRCRRCGGTAEINSSNLCPRCRNDT